MDERDLGEASGYVHALFQQRVDGDEALLRLAGIRELNARLCQRPGGPLVFLEYAAGLDRGWFVEVAEQLRDAERVSCCIDVGHIGLRQVTARFADSHPGLDLKKLGVADHRL